MKRVVGDWVVRLASFMGARCNNECRRKFATNKEVCLEYDVKDIRRYDK